MSQEQDVLGGPVGASGDGAPKPQPHDFDVQKQIHQPIRNDPDEAGLLGAAHLAPAWMFKAHDAILAAIEVIGCGYALRRANVPTTLPLSRSMAIDAA